MLLALEAALCAADLDAACQLQRLLAYAHRARIYGAWDGMLSSCLECEVWLKCCRDDAADRAVVEGYDRRLQEMWEDLLQWLPQQDATAHIDVAQAVRDVRASAGGSAWKGGGGGGG